jgi:hypothetical protein
MRMPETPPIDRGRRRCLGGLACLGLASCASFDPGGTPGPVVEAPSFRVGDRWVYSGSDGFRAPLTWEETHEVIEAGPAVVVVRVAARGPDVDVQRVERWAAPGIVASGALRAFETRRFDPPLVRYRYPMRGGDRWSERIRDPAAPPGPYGPIERYTTVGGYERIVTPAGAFDAIRLRVLSRLDDETFWRTPTECNDLVWYAPALGIAVREEREGEYREKSDARVPWAMIRVQHATLALLAFTRAR